MTHPSGLPAVLASCLVVPNCQADDWFTRQSICRSRIHRRHTPDKFVKTSTTTAPTWMTHIMHDGCQHHRQQLQRRHLLLQVVLQDNTGCHSRSRDACAFCVSRRPNIHLARNTRCCRTATPTDGKCIHVCSTSPASRATAQEHQACITPTSRVDVPRCRFAVMHGNTCLVSLHPLHTQRQQLHGVHAVSHMMD